MKKAFDVFWLMENSVGIIQTYIALVILGLGQGVLTARLLGPAGKGVLAIAVLTANILGQILSCSMGQALQFYVGRRMISEGAALTQAVLFSAVLGGGVAIGLGGLVDWASGAFGVERGQVLVVLPLVPLHMLSEILRPLFIAGDLVKYRNRLEIGQQALTFLFVLLFVAVQERGVNGALAAFLSAQALATSAMVYFFAKQHGIAVRTGAQGFGVVLAYGLKHHGATVLSRAMKRLDSYLLLYWLGSSAVGLYSVASTLAELPMLVARSLQGLVLSYVSSSRKEEADQVMVRLSRLFVSLSIPAYLLYAVVCPWLVPLVFGSQFAGAVNPFFVLLPSSFGLSFYVFIGAHLSGAGHPQFLSYTMLLSTGANVVLSFLLVPSFGLVGNAWATMIASLTAFFATLSLFRRTTGCGYRTATILYRSDWDWIRGGIISVLARSGLTVQR